MRVIAGSAKRLLLKTVEGIDTRPTTDRIKETLFNMIQYHLSSRNFLDLYSGSGAIGIEALSRGSDNCVFIEHNPKAVKCIRDNLQTTKLEGQAYVMECDVLSGLRRLDKQQKRFDFIFMDPPYHLGYEKLVLSFLAQSKLIHTDTQIIVEAALDTPFDYLPDFGFIITKKKEYKTNMHLFLELEKNE